MSKPTTYTILDFCNEELGCEQALDIETQHQLVIYINQLKADFAKFCGHRRRCAIYKSRPIDHNLGECDCGYEEARKRGE